MNTIVKYLLYLFLFVSALTLITTIFSFLDIDYTILYPFLLWALILTIFYIALPKKAGVIF